MDDSKQLDLHEENGPLSLLLHLQESGWIHERRAALFSWWIGNNEESLFYMCSVRSTPSSSSIHDYERCKLQRLQEPCASLQFGSASFTPLMPLNTGAIYCQEKSGTDIGNDRFRSCVPRSALTPLAKKMLVENVIFEIHSTSAKRTETWSQKETHHSNPGRKRV